LNDKFLEIINKFFHRVSSDTDYFYFCTDEERFRQSRNSLDLEDRLINNNEFTATSGPYKFDETNDHESDNDDDHGSNDTVQINDNDEDPELQLESNRRRSDVSSSSLSNRSRELSVRGDILPLFICFYCRLVMKEYDHNTQVKTIPTCISKRK
jgi:hypothetical protein